MSVKRTGSRFKITLSRMPQVFGGKVQLSLSTQPWVDFTGLVSKFDLTVDAGENTQFLDFLIDRKGGKCEFDALTVSDPIEYSDLPRSRVQRKVRRGPPDHRSEPQG